MADPWSGTFTFLLTDIEGSTRLWEAAPTAMAQALLRHDELVAETVGTHRGVLVRSKGEGDSAFAVFEDPIDAITCAVDLQRALANENWPDVAPIRVRMGVHAGPAEARLDDFFGPAVNRAARLRGCAHGGQIVVSDELRAILGTRMPAGISTTDLGFHRLKDLAGPQRIWQVDHAELITSFPELNSLDARNHNLPVQLTTFVGRDIDVLEVRKRLETSPLVTIVGPGGIGKTRLALQVAAEMVDAFPDGVWFVELAGLTDSSQVPGRVAEVLGVREQPGQDLVSLILSNVETKKILMVLDNCEHVLDGCGDVLGALLAQAAGVRAIATSRELLRVYGEALHSLSPLETPDGTDISPESVAGKEAVRLFVDRALLADRDFDLSEHAPAVAAICLRLEGIPLAIELAAALVRSSTPERISARLSDSLASLGQGPRTAPERQQTLRNTLLWSFERLAQPEQGVFACISVFPSPFTEDAARAICPADVLNSAEISALLVSLADRSLLAINHDDAMPRCRMLEPVRAFGGDQLEAMGKRAEVRRLHLDWLLSLATASRRKAMATALSLTEPGYDNARVGLAFALEIGEAESAVDLALYLGQLCRSTGLFTEGREWVSKVLALELPPAKRQELLLEGATLASAQGDQAAAVPMLEDSLRMARLAGDRSVIGWALNGLAGAAVQAGRLDEAKERAAEAVTIFRELDSLKDVVAPLNVMGIIATMEGDESAAFNYFEEALAACREGQLNTFVGPLLMNLGNMSVARSDYVRAREYYTEAVLISDQRGDITTGSAATTNLGVVAKAEGKLETARELFDKALRLKRKIGDSRGQCVALQGLGDVARFEKRFDDARDHIAESLEICRDIEFVVGVIQGLDLLAAVCADQEDAVSGLRFAGAADALRSSTRIKRNAEDSVEFDRSVGVMRGLLSDQDAEAAWQAGSVLTSEQAVREAIASTRRRV